MYHAKPLCRPELAERLSAELTDLPRSTFAATRRRAESATVRWLSAMSANLTRAAFLAAISCGIGSAAGWAAPITLLEVSGAGETFQFIDDNQAAAVGFTLGQAYSNVSISADILCVDCSGEVILMRGDLGPTADLTNFVTAESFDVNSPVDPLLAGLDLDAGDYFLILAMTEAGSAGWIGSDAPVIDSVLGVSAGFNFLAEALDTPSFNSEFLVILTSRGLHFTVTADLPVIAVAAPPTLWMVFGGLALLAFGQRARRFSAL
jgi:hypothetical protein